MHTTPQKSKHWQRWREMLVLNLMLLLLALHLRVNFGYNISRKNTERIFPKKNSRIIIHYSFARSDVFSQAYLSLELNEKWSKSPNKNDSTCVGSNAHADCVRGGLSLLPLSLFCLSLDLSVVMCFNPPLEHYIWLCMD